MGYCPLPSEYRWPPPEGPGVDDMSSIGPQRAGDRAWGVLLGSGSAAPNAGCRATVAIVNYKLAPAESIASN